MVIIFVAELIYFKYNVSILSNKTSAMSSRFLLFSLRKKKMFPCNRKLQTEMLIMTEFQRFSGVSEYHKKLTGELGTS